MVVRRWRVAPRPPALDPADTLAVAPELPRLRLPARVVWGTGDRFQKRGYGQRLARDLGTRPVALTGAKHVTPEDHPRELAKLEHLTSRAVA